MTTKDTYLIGEDVLPAHSLIYERFKVLNELNMIRVNGHKLDVPVKQNIYNDLFKQHKTVTKKRLINYLQSNLQMPERPQITGLSDPEKFNSQLSSYIDLQKILGSEIVDDISKQDDLEKIIEWSTVFEDSRIYKVKLQEIEWLTEKQKNELVSHRYQGWGRLSKKLLVELKDKNGRSIIDLLWNSQRTFMEIQSRPEFAEQITNENQDKLTEDNYEDVLDAAYTSPQNKKAIRQVIKVVDDIVKAAEKAPKFISLELLHKLRTFGSGTYQTHISFQYVEQLRQFINARLPDKMSDWSDTRIILPCPAFFFVTFPLHDHRAELIHVKRLIFPPDPLLFKDQRPRVSHLDDQRNGKHNRRK